MDSKTGLNPENTALKSEETARTALNGCCAETYEQMSVLLGDAVALIPVMSPAYQGALNGIMKELLNAQQKNDLTRIADFLNFELPYILRNLQAPQK